MPIYRYEIATMVLDLIPLGIRSLLSDKTLFCWTCQIRIYRTMFVLILCIRVRSKEIHVEKHIVVEVMATEPMIE